MRQDHRVTVAVGDEHGVVDRADSLQQRVIRDAPCAHSVVLRLPCLPGRGCVAVLGACAEDALQRLVARPRLARRRFRVEDLQVALGGPAGACRRRRSPPMPSRAFPPLPWAPRRRADARQSGRVSVISCATKLPIEKPRRSTCSNSIASRNAMASSPSASIVLRRHPGRCADAGVVERHDSPVRRERVDQREGPSCRGCRGSAEAATSGTSPLPRSRYAKLVPFAASTVSV